MLPFSRDYNGEIITETLLVDGINDEKEEMESVADFIAKIRPSKAILQYQQVSRPKSGLTQQMNMQLT